MNPDTAATVARLRQRIEQLRVAVRDCHQQAETAKAERDEAFRERWSLQKEVSAGKRMAEGYEDMQQTLLAARQREAGIRDGLREVLQDLTALSRYLQP